LLTTFLSIKIKMTLLGYLSRSTSQSTVAIDAQPAAVAEVPTLAPVAAVEEPKETTSEIATPEAVVAPEVLAASSEPTVVAPVCPFSHVFTYVDS
jgi:hypothetical protein